MTAPLVLATALGLEYRSLGRILVRPHPFEEDRLRGVEGTIEDTTVRLVCTGVGPRRARLAAEAIVATKPLGLVITGLAGALSPAIRPGTLVLPHEVRAEPERQAAVHPAAAILATARASIGGDRISITTGALLSVARPVNRPRRKQELFEATGAIAVDMESHAMLEVADAQGLPALALRGVSDGASDALPDLGEADPERLATQLRIAARALRHPSQIRNLLSIAAGTRRALKKLAAAQRALLPALARTLPPRY